MKVPKRSIIQRYLPHLFLIGLPLTLICLLQSFIPLSGWRAPELFAADKKNERVYTLSSIHAHYRHQRPSNYDLSLGSRAPAFTLKQASDNQPVSLSELKGKTVVLIGGSQTCLPFCNTLSSVKKLYARYGSDARFFMVYLNEAHPSVDLYDDARKLKLPAKAPATDIGQKRAYALQFAKDRGLKIPVLVDTLDNRTELDYDLEPSRIVVIGPDGRFAYVGGHGPYDFHPDEAGPTLDRLVAAGRQVEPKVRTAIAPSGKSNAGI